MDSRIEAMVEAARAGGAVALDHYRRGFSVSLKPDRSPVTEADREAERAIGGVLRARFPDHGTLGEELGESGSRDRRFIVDPIDGTRNFVRRIPTWAVLIGLEEDGEVTAGVVYQPATGVLHTARRGHGAWRDGERIRVSPVDALERALVVHSSVNFLRKTRYWDGFLHLADRTQVQRGFGDFSAYLWVAEGQGEIALSTTVKAWDVAALKILVEEAGGRFTDLDGKTGIYGSTVFASNGLLHEPALAAMRERPDEEKA
jgi:histidinol-phosphatase